MLVHVEIGYKKLIVVDCLEDEIMQEKIYPIDDKFYNYLNDKYKGQVDSKRNRYELMFEVGIHLGVWSDIEQFVKQKLEVAC